MEMYVYYLFSDLYVRTEMELFFVYMFYAIFLGWCASLSSIVSIFLLTIHHYLRGQRKCSNLLFLPMTIAKVFFSYLVPKELTFLISTKSANKIILNLHYSFT